MLRELIKLKNEEEAMGRSRGVLCAVAIGLVVSCVLVRTASAGGCPRLIGSYDLPPTSSAVSMDVSNGFLYLTSWDHQNSILAFEIIDVTQPSDPVQTGSIPLGSRHSASLLVSGQRAYVNFDAGGIFDVLVIDVSDPTQPQELGMWAGFEEVKAVQNGLAYTVTEDLVRVFDVTDPASPPVELGSLPNDDGYVFTGDPAVSGDHLFVTNWRLDPYAIFLWAINVSDPSAPDPVGSVQVNADQSFFGLVLSDDAAYVLSQFGSFMDMCWERRIGIVDIRDPQSLSLVADADVGSGTCFGSPATDGRSVYSVHDIGFDQSGIQIFDVQDPSAVFLSGLIETGCCFGNSVVSGTRYFVSYGAVLVFDTQGCNLGPVFRDDFESGDVLAWSGEHAISWWPGDGNADDAIGTNHGTMHGGAGFTTGVVGQAFSFDGVDDYVSIAHDPSLDLGTGDFSVAFWIRTQGFSLSILNKGVHSMGGFDVGFPYPQLVLSKWYLFGWGRFEVTATVIADGSFHHVAFTVDQDEDSGTRAYIDGVLVQTFDPPISGLGPINNSEELLIGWDGDGGFLYGAVDEVMLFRRVITADEVAVLAASR